MHHNDLFRTTFPIEGPEQKLSYRQSSLWIGSCFTENLGEFFHSHGFETMINPFGIVYNPESLVRALQRIISNSSYTAAELRFTGEKYISFDHHSRFSSEKEDQTLRDINTSLHAAHKMLKTASWLFITYGSAYAFRTRDTGCIVANCHKLPAQNFSRECLSLENMMMQWKNCLQKLNHFNPSLQVVFTVSPIRHWRDGAVNNQRSKAALLTLTHALTDAYRFASYFPAYEVMMDDLRDYRFYANDMLHPSEVAVAYLRDRFTKAWIHPADLPVLQTIEQLVIASKHNLRYPLTEESKQFLVAQLAKIEALKVHAARPKLKELELLFRQKLTHSP
ncbi:MAG: GSCFA domain-containing protein [Bacteroidales bacterium]